MLEYNSLIIINLDNQYQICKKCKASKLSAIKIMNINLTNF